MNEQYYLNFENVFRGTRDEIISRLGSYDGIIKYVLNNHEKPNVLDLGSGRGEWLQKCQEAGFESKGIELNTDMVNLSRKYKLDILEGDALTILSQIESNSYQLITSFHVIEHLNFDSIFKIIQHCKRILKPDGLLLFETPSIDNISISTKQFYLDPTHINPINPDGMSFLIEQCGFDKVKYFYINGGPLEKSNKFSFTRILNGVAQDLLIIATSNDVASKNFFQDEKVWKNKLNIAYDSIHAAVQFDESARALELQVQNMESIIENQRKQIEFLLFRQDKIYKSMPLRLLRLVKVKFSAKKIYFLALVNKILNKSNLLLVKFKKKLFTKSFQNILRLTKIMIVLSRTLKLHSLENVFMKISFKLDNIAKRSIAKKIRILKSSEVSINNRLINHYYSSKSAIEIYNQFKNSRN